MSNHESEQRLQCDVSEESSKTPEKKSAKDFIFGKLIGEGSFSMVYLAKDIHSNREFAIKVCEKRHILREKKQKAIMREKQIMNILNTNPSPFFIQLFCTFQDANRLYFVMNYAKYGELLPYIVRVGSFEAPCTRFYTAEILLALEHLHRLNIVHRDLKPENILLNEAMHIQITDFGSAKVLPAKDEPEKEAGKNSFVGTAQYVSPEMLTDKKASIGSDLWALGCIIYHMVSGLPPFRGPNDYLIFQKIMKLEYEFPDGFNQESKDLVTKLLVLNPSQRLGAKDPPLNGYPSIKSHVFFHEFNWENVHLQIPPRILPFIPGTTTNEENRNQYQVPDHLKPGLDDKHMTRLLGLGLRDFENDSPEGEIIFQSSETMTQDLSKGSSPSSTNKPKDDHLRRLKSIERLCLQEISKEKADALLESQAKENPWHRFVQGQLIIKQGLVDKRKGLFARRRMLLLTAGPRLFYVDPVNQILKGEIPCSDELRPEPKNFKTFFVHTPNRTYYLEDPEGYALDWCKAIENVCKASYGGESSRRS